MIALPSNISFPVFVTNINEYSSLALFCILVFPVKLVLFVTFINLVAASAVLLSIFILLIVATTPKSSIALVVVVLYIVLFEMSILSAMSLKLSPPLIFKISLTDVLFVIDKSYNSTSTISVYIKSKLVALYFVILVLDNTNLAS